MATKLQIRRGLKTALPDLAEGELAYATDTKEVFIGTTTTENVQILTGEAGVSPEAVDAQKLKTAVNISLTGDVTGTVSFDGSENVSITTTIVDDSHNHIISNVDGLQTALDLKLEESDLSEYATTQDVTDAIDALKGDVEEDFDTLEKIQIGIEGKSDLTHNHIITQLSGVVISNLADGQVLKYDSTDQVWKNEDDLTSEAGSFTAQNIVDGTGFLKNNGSGTWSYDNTTYLSGLTGSNVTSSGVAQYKVLMADGDGTSSWQYAKPRETLLLTRTSTGSSVAISALTAYDEVILQLKLYVAGSGDDVVNTTVFERQRIPVSLFSYSYVSNSPFTGSTTDYAGAKITTSLPTSNTITSMRVMPVNSTLTNLEITGFSLPTGWELKIYGVKY